MLVPDDVSLFKLVWHPDNLEESVVKPTAFRKDDLSGLDGKHVSVDRSDLSQRSTMEAIAAVQAKNANGKDVLREAPFVGRLSCANTRAIEVNGQKILAVDPFPLEENPAHW